jgi:hypothetical protein
VSGSTAPRSTRAERILQAKQAALTRWSQEDPRDPNGPLPRARAAFERRFLDQVDPDHVLPEPERLRRAAAARKAYYAALSRAAVKARRARRASRPAPSTPDPTSARSTAPSARDAS